MNDEEPRPAGEKAPAAEQEVRETSSPTTPPADEAVGMTVIEEDVSGAPTSDWGEPETVSSEQSSPSKKRKRRRKKSKKPGEEAEAAETDAEADTETESTATPPPPKPQPSRIQLDAEAVAKLARKIYLAEISEEGVALVDDRSAKELSRRCFRLAEIFLEEQVRRN